MREIIKLILQPNCSDLVAHLDILDLEDVKQVLKTVEEITGWIVGFYHYEYDNDMIERYKQINIDDLEIAKSIWEEGDTIGIPVSKLSEDDKKFLHEFYLDENGKIRKDVKVIDVYLVDIKSLAHLSINMYEGYTSQEGLNFRAEQHCITRDFPALAKILRYYSDSYWQTYDGGSANDFFEWCGENNYPYVQDKLGERV